MTIKLTPNLLAATLEAKTAADVEAILSKLDINEAYDFDEEDPAKGWQEGRLHYVPVGFDLGNAGRIKLGNEADNRIAERVVNMHEALIELERRMELKANPSAPAPATPRAAMQRYFSLPSLDQIPGIQDGRVTWKRARALAKKIRVRVLGNKGERALLFEDDGIGQPPSKLHSTILSLGGKNKLRQAYLIGVWGQGGSSALASSKYTWIASRRAPQLGDAEDGVAWTVVKEIQPPDDRRPYYAYLAAKPTGEVTAIPASTADALGFAHGTRIGHIGFDLGTLDPYKMYQALNHLLPNPLMPFDICTKTDGTFDVCWGIGYLLSKKTAKEETNLDKRFEGVAITEEKKA